MQNLSKRKIRLFVNKIIQLLSKHCNLIFSLLHDLVILGFAQPLRILCILEQSHPCAILELFHMVILRRASKSFPSKDDHIKIIENHQLDGNWKKDTNENSYHNIIDKKIFKRTNDIHIATHSRK